MRDLEVERVGDFTVTERDMEAAERVYSKRSKGSRSRDSSFRAPIASDLESWKEDPRGLDFPGVDTPTGRPRHAAYDSPLPGDTAKDDGIGLNKENRMDDLGEFKEEYNTGMDNLADSVTGMFEDL